MQTHDNNSESSVKAEHVVTIVSRLILVKIATEICDELSTLPVSRFFTQEESELILVE